MSFEEIVTCVQNRNAVRTAAGLPVVNETDETARQVAVERNRTFEKSFSDRRHELAQAWSDKRESWLTRAARWLNVRKQAREQFDRASDAGG